MTGKTEPELRAELVEHSRRLYDEGYVTSTDGNLSVRMGGDLFLVTPSGRSKRSVRSEEILKVDFQGRLVDGDGRPTTELPMHLAAYRVRPEVRAVIHAHPTHAIALSLAGVQLAGCMLPEVILDLGTIPTAPYATPGSLAAGDVVAAGLRTASALILDRHGSLTVGRDLLEAYHRLERMEHAAKISHLARQLGDWKTLTPAQMEELLARRKASGALAGVTNCNSCGICVAAPGAAGLPARSGAC